MVTSRRKDLRIKRTTADRLLREFTERVHEVNGDDNYLYRITQIVVFGSYVNNPEYDTLGDLDIGIMMEPKNDREEHRRLCDIKCRECRSADFIEQMLWPSEEVYRRLRNRSPYISLHIIGTDDDQAIFSKDTLEIAAT